MPSFLPCVFLSCCENNKGILCDFYQQVSVKCFSVYMHNKSFWEMDKCFVQKDNLFFRKLN